MRDFSNYDIIECLLGVVIFITTPYKQLLLSYVDEKKLVITTSISSDFHHFSDNYLQTATQEDYDDIMYWLSPVLSLVTWVAFRAVKNYKTKSGGLVGVSFSY